MNDEDIELLKCYHCGRLQYPSNREKGIPCKCNSIHARPAQATWWNCVKYTWHETPGLLNKIRELIAMEIVD